MQNTLLMHLKKELPADETFVVGIRQVCGYNVILNIPASLRPDLSPEEFDRLANEAFEAFALTLEGRMGDETPYDEPAHVDTDHNPEADLWQDYQDLQTDIWASGLS